LSAHPWLNSCRRAATAETGGGGRWKLHSGEPAARSGQQASAGSLWVQGEGLGVLERHREHTKRGAHRGGIHGGRRRARCSRAGEGTTAFIGERKAVGCFLARQGNPVAVGSRHGRSTAGSGRRRATAVGQWRPAGGAVWPTCKRRVARPWARRRRAHRLGSAAHGPLDTGWPRRADPADRGAATATQARARALWSARAPTPLSLALFDHRFLKILQQKWTE
jgi:hypothetical protein